MKLKKSKLGTKGKYALVGVGAFMLGAIMFSGGSTATPAPEVKTVTKEVPVERVVTKEVPVEKTVTVERAPQSCKDVIHLDNQIFTKTADYLTNIFDTSAELELVKFIDRNTESRTAKVADCFSK